MFLQFQLLELPGRHGPSAFASHSHGTRAPFTSDNPPRASRRRELPLISAHHSWHWPAQVVNLSACDLSVTPVEEEEETSLLPMCHCKVEGAPQNASQSRKDGPGNAFATERLCDGTQSRTGGVVARSKFRPWGHGHGSQLITQSSGTLDDRGRYSSSFPINGLHSSHGTTVHGSPTTHHLLGLPLTARRSCCGDRLAARPGHGDVMQAVSLPMDTHPRPITGGTSRSLVWVMPAAAAALNLSESTSGASASCGTRWKMEGWKGALAAIDGAMNSLPNLALEATSTSTPTSASEPPLALTLLVTKNIEREQRGGYYGLYSCGLAADKLITLFISACPLSSP
ncbi:hypothetical protein QBC39DRAFT_328751 [Podospora conica]|nr:hypothetical protein QBC39DRAFT_328751 [Schizothecium conicum]